MLNYDKEKNEVIITGCENCPFCHYKERYADYGSFCSLNEKINVEKYKFELNNFFPDDCSLRDINFKLIRNLNKW